MLRKPVPWVAKQTLLAKMKQAMKRRPIAESPDSADEEAASLQLHSKKIAKISNVLR